MKYAMGYKVSVIFTPEYFSAHALFFLKLANTTSPQPGHTSVCGANCFSAQIDFFSVPSSCLTKMFLSYSKKSNLLLLVRPSQYSPLDGFESVRCEKEYAVLAVR